MKSFIFGYSRLNLPIMGYQFGHGHSEVLILGGVHGDEKEGTIGASSLISHLNQIGTMNSLSHLLLTVVPYFNIEGVLSGQRQNSQGVDLNRNLPTNDWSSQYENPRYNPGKAANSEPENQALTQFIDQHALKMIVSLHSWKPMLNVNGDCGEVAKIISQLTGYEIEPSIGYPTPGCLGTYSGLERHIPTLTYEIERGLEAQKIVQIHVPAILTALTQYSNSCSI